MTRQLIFCFTLLTAGTALASAPDFRLGIDFSEKIPNWTAAQSPDYPPPTAVQIDPQGFIYLLISGQSQGSAGTTAYVAKLNPAADQVVYWTILNFYVSRMVVDPAGNVYLAGPNFVQKWNASGKTIAYTTTLAPDAVVGAVAVDETGRLYVGGTTGSGDLATTPGVLQPTPAGPANDENMFVARLKPDGRLDYATYLGGNSGGVVTGVAVDSSGSAFVTGYAFSNAFPTTPGAFLASATIPNSTAASFLAHLSPDGSSLLYATITDTQGSSACCVAVDSAGSAVVAVNNSAGATFLRFNPQGTAVTFSSALTHAAAYSLAIDAAGIIYAPLLANTDFPVKNSLAACAAGRSAALAALDPLGNVLQTTYLPNVRSYSLALGLAPDSSVYVVGLPAANYTPTRIIPNSAGGLWFLDRLTQQPDAPTVQLACEGNGASHDNLGIAAGEIVSLYGQGLGPLAGIEPQVDPGVQVTFNGIPGPLLYLQDAQINAIAPWSLQGKNVEICVVQNEVRTNCLTQPLLSAHPGVFMADDIYAVAFNQDGTLNSAANPAEVHSWVSILATGLGAINPHQADGALIGLPLPVNVLSSQVLWYEPTGFIGSIPIDAIMNYAGPAPFRVAGVSQLNFIVEDTYTCAIGCGTNPYYVTTVGNSSSQGFLIHSTAHH